jgi:hypothetical protein
MPMNACIVLANLANGLYDAGEKFRMDFEREQLSGNYARFDMFKTRSGRQDMSDNAKIRINKALEGLGSGKDGPNLLQSCAWNVVGSGLTLDGWTHLVRDSGGGMNSDKASGILHGCLELLALHYGMIEYGPHCCAAAGRQPTGAASETSLVLLTFSRRQRRAAKKQSWVGY